MNQYTFDLSIYDNLIEKLKGEMEHMHPFILAIDGMCGSGKTTLAEYLCNHFDASVIHMDNFFLPFERKTKERLAEPGGNIDYERFTEIALPALKKREPFSYLAYNCQTSAYDRDMIIPECKLIIVEGSYSLHERFGKYYDLSLFLSVSANEQLQRLETRCQNETKFARFKNEWIPMELSYHEAQSVRQRADIILDTDSI